jgi:drug/metabolite transporter (DMT)-like permease
VCPDALISLCFRKARLTNAILQLDDGDDEEDEEDEATAADSASHSRVSSDVDEADGADVPSDADGSGSDDETGETFDEEAPVNRPAPRKPARRGVSLDDGDCSCSDADSDDGDDDGVRASPTANNDGSHHNGSSSTTKGGYGSVGRAKRHCHHCRHGSSEAARPGAAAGPSSGAGKPRPSRGSAAAGAGSGKKSGRKGKRRGGSGSKADGGGSADEYRVFRLIFLIFITALAGVLNNLMFVKMGLAMPGYPAFLLYFTTLLYVIIYFVWWALRQHRRRAAAVQWNLSLGYDETGTLFRGLHASDAPAASAAAAGSGAGSSEMVPLLSGAAVNASVSADTNSGALSPGHAKPAPGKKGARKPRALPGPSLLMLFQTKLGWLYLLVGVLVTLGGACSQFSDPHVTGAVQSVINQLTLPLTALFAWLVLGHKFTRIEVIGAGIVMGASLLPILPLLLSPSQDGIPHVGGETGTNSPFWVLIFLLSDFPSALVNVVEELAFSAPYKADEIHYLAFTNLLTLFGYTSMMPLDRLNPGQDPTLAAMSTWDIQRNAFRCFFNGAAAETLPPACEANAYLPVIGFVLCIVVYFYVAAVVVKHESAAFQALANTLVTPVSAIAFSSPMLMGLQAQALDAWTVAAIVLIPAGIVVYKWDDFSGTGKEDEILPLIARH